MERELLELLVTASEEVDCDLQVMGRPATRTLSAAAAVSSAATGQSAAASV